MNSLVANRMVDNYFRLMRDWDTDSKKNLIVKLTSSINLKSNKKNDFSLCFGAWEDTRSADEISNELRADRVNHNEIEEF
ncbi:MAG: hypothetical protein WCR42_11155 [bacterium]